MTAARLATVYGELSTISTSEMWNHYHRGPILWNVTSKNKKTELTNSDNNH